MYTPTISPPKLHDFGGLLLVGIGLQEGVEVAHGQVMAPGDAHPVLVQLGHGGDDIVQVLLGQAAAVDGKADHVGKFGLLLRSLQIVLHGEVAQLGPSDAVPADQLQGEAGAGEGGVIPFAVKKVVSCSTIFGGLVIQFL